MANQLTDRNARILEAAIECALEDGYQWITRALVARKADTATGTVNLAYGDMKGLKRAVLQAAVDRGIIKLVAEGLADGHEIARGAPPEIKAQAAALLMGA